MADIVDTRKEPETALTRAAETLGRGVPARTCVQSVSNDLWYQCNGTTWARPASSTTGPLGACSTAYPL